MKQTLIFISLVFLVALTSCSREPEDNEPESSQGQTTVEVQEGEAETTAIPTRPVVIGTEILADGQLVTVNPTLPLSFKSGGQLVGIHVKAGEELSEGDLVATLDDEALRAALSNAELAVNQAETSLAQAQLSLDDLLNWQPEEMAVSVAEANLAAAEANYNQALSQDAVSGNSLTSARVGLDQAQRNLTDAQAAYDQAWQEARDWELNYNKPICYPGQGGDAPCTGPTWKDRLEQERDGTTRGLQQANDSLSIARANYALAQAGLSDSLALDAAAAVTNAERTLQQAQTGPKENEIAAAGLEVEQAKLSLQQAEFNLEQATRALENAQIHAPWDSIVMSVDVAQGAFVTAGTPIITLLDTGTVQFQTINLSERDLAYIGQGQPAEIIFKTYPSQPISGTVAHIVPQASGQVGDAATFTVVIDIEPTDLRLWSGMTGRAEIQRSEE